MIVEVVTFARNEEPFLQKSIGSWQGQTLKPDRIILVNDGSTDRTGEVARSMGCVVVDLPPHERSLLGLPELANTVNAGLAEVSASADYVVLVGADHALPADYLARLIGRMEANRQIAAASGGIAKEAQDTDVPRNSGFAVRAEVWRKINGMRYPPVWGYELWLLYTLNAAGYATVLFPDITSTILRSTRLKGANDGKAMYALGYDWKYAIGRVAVNFPRQPSNSVKMLVGYIMHRGVERTDIARWINARQKAVFWGRVKARFGVGGKKE